MIDELRARFLPRFLEAAAGRLARSRTALGEGDRTAVMHEMHALAGEASILELRDVATLARSAEQHARAWSTTDSTDAAEKCRTALEALASAVAALSPS